MDKNKPMTDDEYTLAEGNRCPVCRTDMIEGGSIEVNAGTATQEVSCLLCHAEWTDIYNLVGYHKLNIQTKE